MEIYFCISSTIYDGLQCIRLNLSTQTNVQYQSYFMGHLIISFELISFIICDALLKPKAQIGPICAL